MARRHVESQDKVAAMRRPGNWPEIVPMTEARDAGRAAEQALVQDLRGASTPPAPVISRGGRMLEEEGNSTAYFGREGTEARGARAMDENFVVPEDWELQRQSAMDWGYNPYVAEGLFDAPTDQERNSAIRAELELQDRLADPEGRSYTERSSYDQAMLDQMYGPDVVSGADSLGITPDDYLSVASDPMFQAAEADAAQVYAETGGNLDQLELYLNDAGLSPVAIRMILETYSGLGVNSSNVDAGYQLGG